MKLSQASPTSRRSAQRDLSSPTTRPPSKVYTTTIITPLSSTQKTPSVTSVTMLPPRDSANSLSLTPSSSPPPRSTPRRTVSGLSKRPNLQEILSGRSVEPWTLQAFTAYCEKNVCAENLYFIQEAEKYAKRYGEWLQAGEELGNEQADRMGKKLNKSWENMIHLYIQAGSPQEVNLSSSIRDSILSIPVSELPADPIHLEPAVKATHRLIEDSILFTFLSETQIQAALDEEDYRPNPIARINEDRFAKARSMHIIPQDYDPNPQLRSPHPQSASATANYAKIYPKRSTQATGGGIRPRTMFQWKDRNHSESPSLDEVLQDDSSTGTKSPSTSYARSVKTAATPPVSPPPEPMGGDELMRPRSESNSGWKKIGVRLGLKKKTSSKNVLSPGTRSPTESPFSP